MKKEFIVERQGRSFVLYSGLLDLAHSEGLKSIRTELVQVPSEANKQTAICTAIVTMVKDGIERTFTGIGDAEPKNVAPAMVNCLIRMAETRAKARALRDAVNIGVAAFEELGEAEPAEARDFQRPATPRAASHPVRQASNLPRATQSSGAATGEMTEAQEACIRKLCDKTKHELPDFAGMTAIRAGQLIKTLQQAATR